MVEVSSHSLSISSNHLLRNAGQTRHSLAVRDLRAVTKIPLRSEQVQQYSRCREDQKDR